MHYFVLAVLPKVIGLDREKIKMWLDNTMENYSEHNPEAFSYFHDYFISEIEPNYRFAFGVLGKKLAQIEFPKNWTDAENQDFSYWLLPNGEYHADRIATMFGNTAILKDSDEDKTKIFWNNQLKRIKKQYKDNFCIGLDCHIVRI